LENLNRIISNFIIGSQYYRPPTPPVDEFEQDFKKIKDIGLNTIRVWVMWRWIERRKDEYNFSEYDKLFELAERHDIKILINIILPTPPKYIYRERPDCMVVRLDRTIEFPNSAQSAYMIGGYRPCFDNPYLVSRANLFLEKLITRYRDDDNLLAWDIWNEYRIPLCACKYTTERYREWLKKRYKDIDSFNKEFGKAYGYWEDIEPPYNKSDYPEMLAFVQFTLENQGEHLKWVADVVRKFDGKHPVVTHHGSTSTIFSPFIGENTHDERYSAKPVDIYGCTVHLIYYQGYGSTHDSKLYSKYPLALDNARCAKRNYWVAELPSNVSPQGPGEILPGETTLKLWTAVAHGALGIIYWQFKPERLNAEAPGWGLVNYDGSTTKMAEETKHFIKALQQNEELFLNSDPYPAEIALYYDRRIHIINDCIEGKLLEAIHGAYYSFWRENIPVDIVTPEEEWGHYKAIYMPFPILLDTQISKRIKEYVAKGGTVISEAHLGKYRQNGFHSLTIPPEDLIDIFQVKEATTEIFFSHEATWELPSLGDEKEMPLNTQLNFEMEVISDDIPAFQKGLKAYGAYEYARVKAGGAKTLAKFSSGEAAICLNKFENGHAIYVATFPSIYVDSTGDYWTGKLITALSKIANVNPPVKILSPTQEVVTARVMVQKSQNDVLLYVFNHTNKIQDITLELAQKYEKIKEIYGEEAILKNEKIVALTLKPLGVAVYYLKTNA